MSSLLKIEACDTKPEPHHKESFNIEGQSGPKKLQIKLFIVTAMTAPPNDYFYRGTSDSHARTLLKDENGGEVPGACDDV